MDFSTVEVTDDFGTVPTGWYPAFVDKVEWKTSKSGDEYLNVMWKLFGDNYANRVVFDTLNLFNKSEVAKNIAMASVKKILTANNVAEDKMNFATKEELAAALFSARNMVYLKIQKSEAYGDKNTVSNYKVLEESDATPVVDTDSIPF